MHSFVSWEKDKRMHRPLCLMNTLCCMCVCVCVDEKTCKTRQKVFGEELLAEGTDMQIEKGGRRIRVRQRIYRRYKVYFKYQFSRELWQKVGSFTQERYSRLEKEGGRRRGTHGSKEGVRRVEGERMRQREIAEESAAVRAHGSAVPSLRGQTLQWEQLMCSCDSSHSLTVALFLSCV